MKPIDRLAEELPDFLDDLRSAGYVIGVDQYVAAGDLLLSLAARGALPDDPRRLATLLGPVVCKTPAEQDEFRLRFTQWVEGRDPSVGSVTPAEAEDVGGGEGSHSTGLRGDRRLRSYVAALLVVAAVAMLVVFLSVWTGRTPETQTGQGGGVPTTTASAAGKGSETIPGQGGLRPEDAAAPRPNEPNGQAGASSSASVSRWRSRGVLALLPLGIFGFAAWKVWWFVGVRRYLARRPARSRADIRSVRVRGVRESLFPRAVLSRAARNLRRRRPAEAVHLDVKATIDRSARRAGQFSPVAARRRMTPEYLVLVDRASFADHQARLYDELVGQVEAEGVAVTLLHFDADPRACDPAVGNAGSAALAPRDLSARHPDARLIVFADASVFIDPVTGQPASWAALFAAWPERALLTPEPAAFWSGGEKALTSAGWAVLPATAEGLAVLASRLNGDAAEELPPAPAVHRLPEMLAGDPLRWIDRRPPSAPEFEDLIASLKGYLGPGGYAWLAACAVYPEVHWDVTVFLGARMRDRAGRPLLRPDHLSALARLPWFRQGTMPDWLRARLSGELSVPHERAARGALTELFLTALHAGESGTTLEIAEDRPRVGRLLANHVFGRVRPAQPEESPLRERVFASFMASPLPRRLTVALPRTVAAALFSTGRPRRPDRLRRAGAWRWLAPSASRRGTGASGRYRSPLIARVAAASVVFLAVGAAAFLWNESRDNDGVGTPGASARRTPVPAKAPDSGAPPKELSDVLDKVAQNATGDNPDLSARQKALIATAQGVGALAGKASFGASAPGTKSEPSPTAGSPAGAGGVANRPPTKGDAPAKGSEVATQSPPDEPVKPSKTGPTQVASNVPPPGPKASDATKLQPIHREVADRIDEAWTAIAELFVAAERAGRVKSSIDPPPVLDILINGKADDEAVILSEIGKNEPPMVGVSPEVFGAWFTGYGRTPGVEALKNVRIVQPTKGLKEFFDRRAQLLRSSVDQARKGVRPLPNPGDDSVQRSQNAAWYAVARAVVAAQDAGLVNTSIDPPPILDILIDGKADDGPAVAAANGKQQVYVSPEVFSAWFTGYGKTPGIEAARDLRMRNPRDGLQAYYDRRAELLNSHLNAVRARNGAKGDGAKQETKPLEPKKE
ncbi:MAG: hypothetical protein U0835_22100 [Isosphaeraceae bacterium]